ncbi:MAG: GNAT family N-acetyltransferase [Solirubrobacterales bacterium]
MARGATKSGIPYDSSRFDPVERRFWRKCWELVPPGLAREQGVARREFGPMQATIAVSLPEAAMMNLVLGAADPGAVAAGHLAAATDWVTSRGASCCVPVSPGAPETAAAESWLRDNGFEPGYAWMKFVRDAHEPRFKVPTDVEVLELADPREAPFGMILATGFELPAWAAAFFAGLPSRPGMRCYVARLDGRPQACAAMLVDGGVAEFGGAATLEPARGRGCQLALLHRRIRDAAAAGCDTLFVETGERVPGRPSASYRNILRAGFEEAYLRPNWRPRRQ